VKIINKNYVNCCHNNNQVISHQSIAKSQIIRFNGWNHDLNRKSLKRFITSRSSMRKGNGKKQKDNEDSVVFFPARDRWRVSRVGISK